MSYILDALKKAEAERRVGTAAGAHGVLPAAATFVTEERRSVMRTPWPWVAITAVAAALASYSWLRPPPAPVPAVAPVPAAVPPAPVVSAPAPAPVHPPVAAAPRPQEPAAKQTEETTSAPKPEPRAEEMADDAPPPKKAKAVKPAEKKLSTGETKAAEAPAPLPTLRELPDDIQRAVPQLTVGGYIYAGNKADRSVIINGRLLHEGEEAAPGLVLEKMLPNGMVLNYRGHRYRTGY